MNNLPYELILQQLMTIKYDDIRNFCKIDTNIYSICKKELPRLSKKWLIDLNITSPNNLLFTLRYCKWSDEKDKIFFTFINRIRKGFLW